MSRQEVTLETSVDSELQMEVFPGPGETHVEKRLHKKCLVINPGLD